MSTTKSRKKKEIYTTTRRIGFTTFEENDSRIRITHCGNMGNSITRSVDPNLKLIKVDPVAKLKKTHTVEKESGWPDYDYELILLKK